MRKIQIAILMCAVMFSCSKKGKHEAESGDWKELESFHKLMAKVYHPLKDSGNLTPARLGMGQLADEAEKWSGAALPDKVNTPEVKERLQTLRSDARTLANEIANGASDEMVKDKVIKLHDQFHSIMEAWNHHDEDEDEDEHEDH